MVAINPSQLPPPSDIGAVNLAKAIRTVESNSNFNAKGKSGEFGAYQFMPQTWSSYAGKYLGDANAQMTKENQNFVAYSKIKELKDQGFSPDQVASIWNSGKPDYKGNVGTNSKGVAYNTPKYVDSVLGKYQQLRQGVDNGPTLPNPSQAEQPKSVGGFIGNIFNSGANAIGGIGNALLHPVDTLKNIGQAVTHPSQILDLIKQRYGSLSNIGDTLYNDPIGAALDVSTLLDGVGAGLNGLGRLSETSKLAEAANAAKTLTESGGGIQKFVEASQAAREPSALTQAGQVASRASELTNPLHGLGVLGSKVLGSGLDATANKFTNLGYGVTANKAGAGLADFSLENRLGYKTESGLAKYASETNRAMQDIIEPALKNAPPVNLVEIASKVVQDFNDFNKTNFSSDELLKNARDITKGHEYIVDKALSPIAGGELGSVTSENANAFRKGLDTALKTEKGKVPAGPLPLDKQLLNKFKSALRAEVQRNSTTQAEFAKQSGALTLRKQLETLAKKGATQGRPGLLDIGGALVGGVKGVAIERLVRSPLFQRVVGQGIYDAGKLAAKLATLAPAERLKYLSVLSRLSSSVASQR